MIRRLPGWLNFILLFAVYYALGLLLDLVTGFHADKRFIGLFCAFWAGAYLAKWRFMDNEWRFF
jgi:hypothetical protein